MKHTTLLLRHLTLLALLASLPLLGCGGKGEADAQQLYIEWHSPALHEDSEWLLLTYGAESITATPLKAKKAGVLKSKIAFSRDTLDLFLLLNGEGQLLLPLLPDTLNAKVVARDTLLQMEGLRHPEVLTQWYQLLCTAPEDEISGSMMELLQEHSNTQVAPYLALGLLLRYPHSPCSPELRQLLATAPYQLQQLTGLQSTQFPSERHHLPYNLQLYGRKDTLMPTTPLISPAPYMVLAFEDGRHPLPDSLFHRRLNSLKVPLYQAHLFSDTLPSGHKVIEHRKQQRVWRYFLVDSLGEASKLATDVGISALPSYMIADSTRLVWREWHHRDSLLHFLEQLQAK